LKTGFSDILQKPFTKEMFMQVLTKLFPEAVHEKPENKSKQISLLVPTYLIGSHSFIFRAMMRKVIAEVLHLCLRLLAANIFEKLKSSRA